MLNHRRAWSINLLFELRAGFVFGFATGGAYTAAPLCKLTLPR
jgi:hypothetical protein